MPEPGWYDDPWNSGYQGQLGGVRWWDGTQWTAHTTQLMPAGASPLDRLGSELRWAIWARRGLAGAAILSALSLLAVSLTFGHQIHHVIHQFDRWNTELQTDPNASPPNVNVFSFAWLELLSLPELVGQIFFVTWFYQAAQVAEKLRIPTRRSPVWAILGFIVPIVNLWFPYQVAVGLFPPNDQRGRLAGRWWGWYLAQGIASSIATFISIANQTVGFVVAICVLPLIAIAYRYARQLVVDSTECHQALITGR